MNDQLFFRVIGVLQLLISACCFYTAALTMQTPSVFNLSVSAMCMVTGVFTTVVAARLMGLLK